MRARVSDRLEFGLRLGLPTTPSAIYHRPVWRHIITYRQDLADAYINARKSSRGVFFVEPDERKSSAEKKREKEAAANRPVANHGTP